MALDSKVAEHFRIDHGPQLHRNPLVSSRAQREIFPIPSRVREERFLTSFEMTQWEFAIFLIVIVCVSWLSTSRLYAAEKLRAAYPAVAPGSTPSWVTAEKR